MVVSSSATGNRVRDHKKNDDQHLTMSREETDCRCSIGARSGGLFDPFLLLALDHASVAEEMLAQPASRGPRLFPLLPEFLIVPHRFD